jgi:hypothetical protein
MAHAAHFGREEALGRNELQFGATIGDNFGCRHARVSAIVVKQQDLSLRLHSPGKNIP